MDFVEGLHLHYKSLNMKLKTYRRFVLTILLLFGLGNVLSAQDFYKAYTAYLDSVMRKHKGSYKKSIETSIKRLQRATARYEKEKNRPFFTSDTVYLVDFFGAETSFESAIIWNKYASCYYGDTMHFANRKMAEQKLEIRADASEILLSFNNEFRQSIETGDTSRYLKYADQHKVFDGQWVSPLMAIRTDDKWYFIPFRGNGRAISY